MVRPGEKFSNSRSPPDARKMMFVELVLEIEFTVGAI